MNNQRLADLLTAQEEESRRRLTHSGPPPKPPLSFWDTMALSTAPIPVVGDALGLAADVNRYLREPQSRTPLNFGLSALGLLPFVPAVAGTLGKGGAKLGKTLDLTPEARMSRAKEQGYIGPLYHGTVHDEYERLGAEARTQADWDELFARTDLNLTGYQGEGITAFDPKRIGSNTDKGWYAQGIYTSPAPAHANHYAPRETSGATVYPLMARIKNPFIVNRRLGPTSSEGGPEMREKLLALKGWTPDEVATIGSHDELSAMLADSPITSERLTELLKANDYDGVIVNKVYPNRPELTDMNSEVIAFEPHQMRSIFANFDPNKQGSSDLLASLLLGGIGLPLMMQAAQNPEHVDY
jgi:ADP-Ribosyltransferase in polyvalent proteins